MLPRENKIQLTFDGKPHYHNSVHAQSMLSPGFLCEVCSNDKVRQSILYLSPSSLIIWWCNAYAIRHQFIVRGRFAHTTGIPAAIDSIGG